MRSPDCGGLSALNPGTSLAKLGGPLMSIGLAGTMIVSLLGSSWALHREPVATQPRLPIGPEFN